MTPAVCKVCKREAAVLVTTVAKLTRVECTECIPCRRAYERHIAEDAAIAEAERRTPAPTKRRAV